MRRNEEGRALNAKPVDRHRDLRRHTTGRSDEKEPERSPKKLPLRSWLLALAVTLVYPLVAFYPYEWRSPLRANHAEWLREGILRFSEPGLARTDVAPPWLGAVRRSHYLDVSLRVRPLSIRQSGPARILTISKDPHLRNLTLGQQHDRLVVRLQTPDRDANGLPAREIPSVFTDTGWLDIAVSISPGRLLVTVDGEPRLDEQLSDAPLASFNSAYPLALGNELTGNRPWLGDIARATITSEGLQVNYLEPARLQLPPRLRFFHNPPEFIPFRQFRARDALFNLLGFVPIGMVVGWLTREHRRRLTLWAVVPVACLSLGIEVAQWAMPARYTSTEDLLLNTLGGTLGLIIASRAWPIGYGRGETPRSEPPVDDAHGIDRLPSR